MIETPRLLLRELTDADHEALYGMYQDPRMNRFLGGPPPPRDAYWRQVRETWPAYYARHGFALWATVRREDGRLIGRCGLLSQEIDGERHVEVAYALGTEFWGRGYATEAARACRDHAFRDARGAAPHLPHPSGQRGVDPGCGEERDGVLEDGGVQGLPAARVPHHWRGVGADDGRRRIMIRTLHPSLDGWNPGTRDLDTRPWGGIV